MTIVQGLITGAIILGISIPMLGWMITLDNSREKSEDGLHVVVLAIVASIAIMVGGAFVLTALGFALWNAPWGMVM